MVIDFAYRMHNHQVSFHIFPELWEEFLCEGIDLGSISWMETKFLSEDGAELNDGMSNLPNDKGGIYVFYTKCNVLPGISNYLMYIGRARVTDDHNLRVRCRKYFGEYSRENGRPKIQRMIGQWGKHLYLKYIALDDNDLITRLEASLIKSIVPPFNDDIPDKKIKAAVKAF